MHNNIHRIWVGAVAALMIGLTTPQASAVSCGGGVGDTDNFTTSTACATAPSSNKGGNVRAGDLNAGLGLFGVTGWQSLEKLETTDGRDDIVGDVFELTSNANNSSGTWTLRDGFSFTAGETYAFIMKGAENNIAYLVDPAFSGGVWANDDIPANKLGKAAPGLSNITLFGTSDLVLLPPAPQQLTQTPIPAALPLFATAIGAIGFVGWRRRTTLA